jgi:MinD superfamily P-loop ATPase
LLLIEILPNKCDFCGVCVAVCPEDAIELREADIKIIELLCTNCEKCVWCCPLEVLIFRKDKIRDFKQQAMTQ